MLLKNARLIPYLTEGFEGGLADVLIEGERIAAIYPAGMGPEGAEALDLGGKTLMPGMYDLHIHLYFHDHNFEHLSLLGQNQHFVNCLKYAKTALRHGYTSVRDVGNPDYIGPAVRDSVNDGVSIGPRIYTAGYCITPTAMGNETFANLYDEFDDPAEALGICRREMCHGIDFLKYMVTGAVANANGSPGALVTTREELEAMQRAAETLGTRIAGHAHGADGVLLAAQVGIWTIEHATLINDEAIEEILRHNCRSALVPTMMPIHEQKNAGLYGDYPEYLIRSIEILYSGLPKLVEAARAGIMIGWGMDTSMETLDRLPGYEFLARRDIGFTNREMLEQATINSAKILGVQDELGTVKAGKLADLIAVDGKPDEDIECMYKLPDVVIKGGVRYF